MLNVFGKVRVTNIKEVSGNLLVGDVYTFEKVGDDYITHFTKAKFVGKALEFIVSNNIQNKDKLEIKSAILKQESYNGNKYNCITVFEVDKVKEEVKEDEKPKTKYSKYNRK